MYFQIVRSTENPFPGLNFLELQMLLLLLLLPKQSRLKRFSSRRNFIFRFVTLRFSITCAALVGDGWWFENWPLYALEPNQQGMMMPWERSTIFCPFADNAFSLFLLALVWDGPSTRKIGVNMLFGAKLT